VDARFSRVEARNTLERDVCVRARARVIEYTSSGINKSPISASSSASVFPPVFGDWEFPKDIHMENIVRKVLARIQVTGVIPQVRRRPGYPLSERRDNLFI
jgi:hypothetical protein